MNRKTMKEWLKFTHDELGGEKSQELLLEGGRALKDGVVLGIPHIFTIKHALVPNNSVYQFAEPDYLGRAYVLQKPRMFVEKRRTSFASPQKRSWVSPSPTCVVWPGTTSTSLPKGRDPQVWSPLETAGSFCA